MRKRLLQFRSLKLLKWVLIESLLCKVCPWQWFCKMWWLFCFACRQMRCLSCRSKSKRNWKKLINMVLYCCCYCMNFFAFRWFGVSVSLIVEKNRLLVGDNTLLGTVMAINRWILFVSVVASGLGWIWIFLIAIFVLGCEYALYLWNSANVW